MINTIAKSCEELKLSGILLSYQSIADESAKLKASYTEYLEQVLKYELMIREQRSCELMLKIAGFPVLKKLEQFDFSCSNINEQQVKELAGLQFIADKENIILIGSPGTGKTHLAVSLGYLATLQRMKVKFVTAADLLLQLEAAQQQNKLKNYLGKIIAGSRLLTDVTRVSV